MPSGSHSAILPGVMATLLQRFLSKIVEDPQTGCWLWTGARHKRDRYALFKAGGRCRQAHRVSYEIFVGEIPAGLDLDHTCRRRECVCPRHLAPVTERENVINSASPQAARERQLARTHCKRKHAFTPENTRYNAQNVRVCKACDRLRQRAYKQRKRKRERIVAPPGQVLLFPDIKARVA